MHFPLTTGTDKHYVGFHTGCLFGGFGGVGGGGGGGRSILHFWSKQRAGSQFSYDISTDYLTITSIALQ